MYIEQWRVGLVQPLSKGAVRRKNHHCQAKIAASSVVCISRFAIERLIQVAAEKIIVKRHCSMKNPLNQVINCIMMAPLAANCICPDLSSDAAWSMRSSTFLASFGGSQCELVRPYVLKKVVNIFMNVIAFLDFDFSIAIKSASLICKYLSNMQWLYPWGLRMFSLMVLSIKKQSLLHRLRVMFVNALLCQDGFI